MAWELTGDLEAFDAAAGDFLRARPVLNTTVLTLIDVLRRRGPHAYGVAAPVFGTWRDPDATVTGAVLQTPPRPMVFTSMPPAALSAAASTFDPALTGVNLPDDLLGAFTGPWCARTGVRGTVDVRLRLYRLGTLIPPATPGRARPARTGDRAALVTWLTAFLDEIGEHGADVAAIVDEKLAGGLIAVAEDGDVPRAMATRTAPVAGASRIQHVYTPPEFRGRGYAGAATAYLARSARDAGEVVLFADRDNTTSNALYRRLGFRPAEDRTVVVFG
jgi:RimJ/RimL family protein N-acetyltransferase